MLSTLQKRFLTAFILIPILIASVLYLPISYFRILLAMIFGLAAWEWTQFVIKDHQNYLARILVWFGLTGLTIFFILKVPLIIILLIGLAWWFIAWLALLNFPKGKSFWSNPIVGFLAGILVLVPAVTSANYIFSAVEFGRLWLLYLILIVAANDTGAFFVGRAFKGPKLSPTVSPGKTWSGAIGGILVVILVCAAFLYWTDYAAQELILFALTISVAIFSVIGDLTESLFKRCFNLKDSGQILPGHGGVLDRIDSFTSSLPLFAFFKIFF